MSVCSLDKLHCTSVIYRRWIHFQLSELGESDMDSDFDSDTEADDSEASWETETEEQIDSDNNDW